MSRRKALTALAALAFLGCGQLAAGHDQPVRDAGRAGLITAHQTIQADLAAPLPSLDLRRDFKETRASRSQPIKPVTVTTAKPIVRLTPKPVVRLTPPPVSVPDTEGDKAFIYMRESHNNPASVNSHGCVGLGQNCPDRHGNVAVVAACPNWRTDYACQDDWFTNRYMIPRYGTWARARAFWVSHSWW